MQLRLIKPSSKSINVQHLFLPLRSKRIKNDQLFEHSLIIIEEFRNGVGRLNPSDEFEQKIPFVTDFDYSDEFNLRILFITPEEGAKDIEVKFRLFSLPTVGSTFSEMQFMVGTFLPHRQRSVISQVNTGLNFEFTKTVFDSAAIESIDSEYCGESTRFRISLEFPGFVKKHV